MIKKGSKKSMERTLVVILLASFLAVACAQSDPPSIINAPTYEAGLQFFPSPRRFDPPGTVFRIDPNGVRRPIADLSGLLPLEARSEAVPRMSRAGVLHLGLLMNWLGLEGLRAGVSKVDSVTIYVGGATREQAFEVDLRAVVDSARKIVDWERPGSIYVITETVSADTIAIRLSQSSALALGNAIKGDSLGNGVEWTPQGITQLNLRFKEPHRIFYKAEHLVRRFGGLEVDSAASVVLVPLDRPLVWEAAEGTDQ